MRVSIIMPTYNRAATLPRAIESVLAQTYADWELLIVDDASTDETGGVIGRYADPRIHAHRLRQNGGAPHARNFGLAQAQGKLLQFLDSDDALLPHKLSEAVGMFRENVDVVVSEWHYVTREGVIEAIRSLIRPQGATPNLAEQFFTKQIKWPLPCPLWRRSYLERHAVRFNERLTRCQDFQFHFQALIRGPNVRYLDDAGAFVHLDATNRISKTFQPAFYKSLALSRTIAVAQAARHGKLTWKMLRVYLSLLRDVQRELRQ